MFDNRNRYDFDLLYKENDTITIEDNTLPVKARRTRIAIFNPCVAGASGAP